jgi:hypothetical protein
MQDIGRFLEALKDGPIDIQPEHQESKLVGMMQLAIDRHNQSAAYTNRALQELQDAL